MDGLSGPWALKRQQDLRALRLSGRPGNHPHDLAEEEAVMEGRGEAATQPNHIMGVLTVLLTILPRVQHC